MPGVPSEDKLKQMKSEHQVFGYSSLQALENAKGGIVSPQTLQKLYNVPPPPERGTQAKTDQEATWQVVFGTLGQFWSPSDRAEYQRSFGIPDDNFVRQMEGETAGNAMSGDGECRKDPNHCAEANLDVQAMMGVSPWSRIGYWYTPSASSKGMSGFLNE